MAASILGLMSIGMGAPSSAASRPNILIMGEDADRDTVPRNSRVFQRVLGALVNQMQDGGFHVYDETAATLDRFEQGRARRADKELIDIARSITRPPIDVVVMYSIYASARKQNYTTKIWTRITGRLLDVRTGRRLGNFEVELPRPDNAPVKCNRGCILETVGKNARALAMDLGAVLAERLNALSPSERKKNGGSGDKDGRATAFTLVFSGFTAKDMAAIDEYIAAFRGYEHHRPVSTSLRTHEYWYETTSDALRLNRNFELMLDQIEMEGRVTYSGNRFQVEKLAKRQ